MFQVGQRVRIIGARYPETQCEIGLEGVIEGYSPDDGEYWVSANWRSKLDGWAPDPSWRSARACDLAPLPDPGCTEFIARMKREYLNDRVALLRIGNGALEHQLRALYPDELDGIRGGAA